MTMFGNVYRRRSSTLTLTMRQYDGSLVVLSAGDVVRVKIGVAGKAPLLDMGSDAATANGSHLTAANPTTVVLNEDDLDLTPGIYDLELAAYDASQTQFKHADKGVICVHDTQLGETGP